MIKLTKELEAAQKDKKASAAAARINPSSAMFYIKHGSIAVLSFVFWNTAVATLPAGALGPISVFLSFPGWARGTLGIVAWLMLLNTIINRLVRALAGAMGLLPPPTNEGGIAGLVQSAMGMLKS